MVGGFAPMAAVDAGPYPAGKSRTGNSSWKERVRTYRRRAEEVCREGGLRYVAHVRVFAACLLRGAGLAYPFR